MGGWQDAAACRGLDPALFFPDPMDTVAVDEAKAVCARCPVTLQCLTYACANDQRAGVWGGQSESERKCSDDDEVPPPPLCCACGGDLIPVGDSTACCVECGSRWPML